MLDAGFLFRYYSGQSEISAIKLLEMRYRDEVGDRPILNWKSPSMKQKDDSSDEEQD